MSITERSIQKELKTFINKPGPARTAFIREPYTGNNQLQISTINVNLGLPLLFKTPLLHKITL